MRGKILLFMVAILLVVGVSGLDFDNQERINFGHVIVVSDLLTEPSTIEPGVPAKFNMIIENSGSSDVNDIRISLNLPDEIGFFNDVSQKTIFKLFGGDKGAVDFNLMALPGSAEGVYEANLTTDYVSHIGEERQDSYSISIIVKSKPKIYVQIDESDVYKGKKLGEITVKFVNNDVADVKFLTVELMESDEYEIISAPKVYIGDLDSDDFESIDYKIKTKKSSGEVMIPLKITYKDAMNNPIEDELAAVLIMHDGKDLGKVQSNTLRNVIGLVVVLGAGYWFWRRWKKKKKKSLY